ncbi:MAG: class I SAM-dependent methyltransferase [Fibrobacterota bacterium]|nr:class I SAM-dependent methyltransferase [Fibrobacterota bacterium]QQS03161.1 MAG: class I SAM-dependent methyltransferase [Fibrobacterota bacterium]
MSRTTFYDLVSPLYPLVDVFLAPQKRRLCEEVRDFAPNLLLEIGAGNGSHRELLHGTRSIGVDVSRRMLGTAVRQNPSTFSALLADGLALPLADACVDAVVLSHVASVVPDPAKLLAESHRVLRAGGRLWILNHFTPASWVGAFDRMVRPLGPILGLKTVFRVEDLSEGLSAFTPLANRPIGAFSYYRLLTLAKP